MKKNKQIVVTGGNGRFGKILRNKNFKNYIFPSKSELDITNIKSIDKYFKNKKISTVIHLAVLSRPMSIHEKKPEKSILLNIIGTSNLVIICKKYNIKIIYFSTSYVYPGISGNYKENDALLPFNNYSWSKLGGECAVKMYRNSLILRVCMTEKPFVHKKALSDVKLNLLFQDEVVEILKKVLNRKGILNIGGPAKTVYQFARKYDPYVKKIKAKDLRNINFPKNSTMNLSKLKKIINY